MKRTLTLRSETLAELADDDLTGVVGGRYSGRGLSCPILDCLNETTPPRCQYATFDGC